MSLPAFFSPFLAMLDTTGRRTAGALMGQEGDQLIFSWDPVVQKSGGIVLEAGHFMISQDDMDLANDLEDDVGRTSHQNMVVAGHLDAFLAAIDDFIQAMGAHVGPALFQYQIIFTRPTGACGAAARTHLLVVPCQSRAEPCMLAVDTPEQAQKAYAHIAAIAATSA